MKTHRISLIPVVGSVILLAFVSMAAVQGPIEGAATVIRMNGSARSTTGNFVWQPIKVGDVLRPGTVIQTSNDEDCYVDLALGDAHAIVRPPSPYRPGITSSLPSAWMSFQPTSEQNVVRIWKDSALAIDKLNVLATGAEQVTETELDLKRGRIAGNVKKLAAGSKYEVKVPNGVAGVRGTVFEIQAVGVVEVYIGSMVVAWVDPKTQKVTTQTVVGGQAYDAASNQVSPLSPTSTIALEQLSAALLVTSLQPNFITLASDRTLIGMSPVGASPASIPKGGNSSGDQSSGVVITFTFGPPPVPPRP